jgi:hypothetical protein
MAAFQSCIQSRKERKVELKGDDRYVVFGKKSQGEEESVRRCVVMMQQSILLSPNFGEKSPQIFMQSP